jgi:hypothetical protein
LKVDKEILVDTESCSVTAICLRIPQHCYVLMRGQDVPLPLDVFYHHIVKRKCTHGDDSYKCIFGVIKLQYCHFTHSNLLKYKIQPYSFLLLSGCPCRIWKKLLSVCYSYVEPCHHGTARPQVADEGAGLQIRRVAANILSKQSQTAGNGWASDVGFGRGTNNSSP